MRWILSFVLAVAVMAVADFAQAGGNVVRVNHSFAVRSFAVADDYCAPAAQVEQVYAQPVQRVFVPRQRVFAPRVRVNVGGGSTFVRERSFGPFGLFGRSRTIIQN